MGNASQPAGSPSPEARQLQSMWESGARGAALRGALTHWPRISAEQGNLRWLEEGLRRSGLSCEALELQLIRTRRSDDPAAWHALIQNVLNSGDPWWADQLLAEFGPRSRQLRTLQVEIELALGDAAAAISAWLRDYQDGEAVAAAIGWWVRQGRIEAAEQLLQTEEGADCEAIRRWRARLLVWRRQPGAALAALATLPADPALRCLTAVATLRAGDAARAESMLRELADTEAQAEAWSWLAYQLRKRGCYSAAVQAADRANAASTSFNLIAFLERELADELERAAEAARRVSPLQRLWQLIGLRAARAPRTIAELERASALYPLGVEGPDPLTVLDPLLERFGGNRSCHITVLRDGTLSSFRLPPDPRHLGAQAQLVLWTRGAEAARAVFRQRAEALDHSPLFLIYQGEMELWPMSLS